MSKKTFQVRIFKTIRIEEASRNLLVYDRDNILVSSARLGVNMGHDLHPYKCLPGAHEDLEKARCFEWPDRATLTISREEGVNKAGGTCHRIVWNMLNKVNISLFLNTYPNTGIFYVSGNVPV